MTLENEKLTTVTNLSIQRKRLREFHEYFNNKDITVSIKPATIEEYEVFVLEFHGLDLETIYDMKENLKIDVMAGMRLDKDYYRIVIQKDALEKGNPIMLYRHRDNNLEIHRLFQKYLGVHSFDEITIILN